MGTLKDRWTARMDTWFAPREIILRSERGVTYRRFSKKSMMGMGVLLASLTALLTSSLIGSFAMGYFWYKRGQDLTEMELAYSGLVSEMKAQLASHPGSDSAGMLALIQSSHAEKAQTFTQRMTESQAAIGLMEQERALLQSNLRRTEAALAQEKRVRLDLEENVAKLGQLVAMGQTQEQALQSKLEETSQALEKNVEDQHQLEMAKNDAENALRDASQRLNDTKAAYSAMLANLTERAHSSLEEMEKIISKAGLKVDDMLAQVDDQTYGQGGPFIPASSSGMSSDHAVAEQVAPLDKQVSRLEKLHIVLRSLPLSAPVDRYYVSSSFGGRADPFNGEEGFHGGMDMVGTIGTDVLSTAPGKVVFAGWRGNYGKVVEIDHGFGLATVYAHLKETLVEEGQEVSYRQKIGLLGNTGRSSGPHVHYEIRYRDKPMNPDKFLQAGRYVFKG